MHSTASRPLRVALSVAAASLVLSVALAGCSPTPSGTLAQPASAGGSVTESAAGLTDDDGYIPDGSSLPLDSDLPAVSRLDPDLLSALKDAQDAMQGDSSGPGITIADGWRSERYQEHLFAQAVQEYGSEEEAEKWVKRGSDSAHVRGEAVDIADAGAMDYLNRYGSEWGLCQVYANEAWHFELRTEPGGDCPAQSPDGRG
ncbi:M15 family metallopeptidase [Leifsonia sp. fls2-241-R2A-40a]|uniref:M15 family metallopeptidase n=1 Tax=Leifsonia sp. fls2-241-R2A-40a TaxID=3040290 RepID=UPI00254E8B0B|nr:M15 family metallopeptidase [Leifsonia sp. fls2-241-R2A-40a]